MVAVVYGGARELDMFISGEPHPGTLQYLRGQMQNLSNYMGNVASEWSQRAMGIYEQFSSDNALRHARAALQKVSSYGHRDAIRELKTMSDFQNAPFVMQRYLMSDPFIRDLYHRQQTDGYSKTYNDAEPGMIGRLHSDWRKVDDGWVHDIPATEEDPTPSWYFNTHFDEEDPDDPALNHTQQRIIKSSQDEMREHFLAGEMDPGSQSGGYL